ncbi:hypothetical protein MOP44_06215 [Occallatibacter riparius]|uniref:Uncharacterized protein n=1 Tax=Occallatibacter riparius TaxID=1002689 RepID=A0A9J7BRL9_9BACT|nr:hypothetical protein [Occallatibacter riparius]UWZ85532.1 hypothetical protein MOP44_06215 [Occallatibacter riparius]
MIRIAETVKKVPCISQGVYEYRGQGPGRGHGGVSADRDTEFLVASGLAIREDHMAGGSDCREACQVSGNSRADGLEAGFLANPYSQELRTSAIIGQGFQVCDFIGMKEASRELHAVGSRTDTFDVDANLDWKTGGVRNCE